MGKIKQMFRAWAYHNPNVPEAERKRQIDSDNRYEEYTRQKEIVVCDACGGLLVEGSKVFFCTRCYKEFKKHKI